MSVPTRQLTPSMFDAERFAGRVRINEGTGCHLWTGHLDRDGYGQFTGRDGAGGYVTAFAHRVAFVLDGRALKPGQVIDHLCRNRACVNPAHMEATTVQVNTARGIGPTAASAAARLVGRCVNGHDLAEVGVHKQRNGVTCAECGRERVRRYAARRRTAA